MELRESTLTIGPARHALALAMLAAALVASSAPANINLSLSPSAQTVTVGSTVSVQLIATSDTPGSIQLMAAIQSAMTWQPAFLQLTGVSQAGAIPLLSSGFPADPYGLNESFPPADGTAMYVALALLGIPAAANPAGSLITTLQFQALAPTATTPINLPLSLSGSLGVGPTIVFDGVIPNLNVLGSLSGATITINPVPAPGALGAGALAWLTGAVARPGARRRT